MKHRLYLAILLSLIVTSATTHAQEQADNSDFTNRQLREKSSYRQKTTLGVFTIGSHGLVKNEREQAKTGDLEVGRVFEFKHNQFIPRVVELETFVVNRLGSYEDSLYESLGIGAGSQLNYRKESKADKWFMRFTAVVPSEYYQERYGIESEQTVYELTVGRSHAFAPLLDTQRLKRRLASYSLTATVPQTAVESKAWSDANAVGLLSSYLAAHYFQISQADVFAYDELNAFDFIIQRSGVMMNEHETQLMALHNDRRIIPERWRQTYHTLFRRAMTVLLRDRCRIVFEVRSSQSPQGLQAFSVLPDGHIQHDAAIDPDRMIQTYVQAMWPRFRTPAD